MIMNSLEIVSVEHSVSDEKIVKPGFTSIKMIEI